MGSHRTRRATFVRPAHCGARHKLKSQDAASLWATASEIPQRPVRGLKICGTVSSRNGIASARVPFIWDSQVECLSCWVTLREAGTVANAALAPSSSSGAKDTTGGRPGPVRPLRSVLFSGGPKARGAVLPRCCAERRDDGRGRRVGRFGVAGRGEQEALDGVVLDGGRADSWCGRVDGRPGDERGGEA